MRWRSCAVAEWHNQRACMHGRGLSERAEVNGPSILSLVCCRSIDLIRSLWMRLDPRCVISLVSSTLVVPRDIDGLWCGLHRWRGWSRHFHFHFHFTLRCPLSALQQRCRRPLVCVAGSAGCRGATALSPRPSDSNSSHNRTSRSRGGQ